MRWHPLPFNANPMWRAPLAVWGHHVQHEESPSASLKHLHLVNANIQTSLSQHTLGNGVPFIKICLARCSYGKWCSPCPQHCQSCHPARLGGGGDISEKIKGKANGQMVCKLHCPHQPPGDANPVDSPAPPPTPHQTTGSSQGREKGRHRGCHTSAPPRRFRVMNPRLSCIGSQPLPPLGMVGTVEAQAQMRFTLPLMMARSLAS
jgi:hypothetical protein